jgi:hypothetical protein
VVGEATAVVGVFWGAGWGGEGSSSNAFGPLVPYKEVPPSATIPGLECTTFYYDVMRKGGNPPTFSGAQDNRRVRLMPMLFNNMATAAEKVDLKEQVSGL